MKTKIGGERLGSGKKMTVNLENYGSSNFNHDFIWRSSMSAGTLVPFMSKVALPGDKHKIELNCEVLTLPTIGPLFGTAKVQLDVFSIPMRLYNGKLHMNLLDLGLNMKSVTLPQIGVKAKCKQDFNSQDLSDNAQIGTSCILKYLGISGIGACEFPDPESETKKRYFNAIPLLAYWDIFKNYYSNKQEEDAYVIHTGAITIAQSLTPQAVYWSWRENGIQQTVSIYDDAVDLTIEDGWVLVIQLPDDALEPDLNALQVGLDGTPTQLTSIMDVRWSPLGEGENQFEIGRNLIIATNFTVVQAITEWEWNVVPLTPENTNEVPISLTKFPLENIDKMRKAILVAVDDPQFVVDSQDYAPYNLLQEEWGTDKDLQLSIWKSQEGLAVKTYQSDLFNNWMDKEWIDGDTGVNALSRVLVDSDGGQPLGFNIDSFNIMSKVYVMLNRIAISGGSYDDWLEATYTADRRKSVENPMYMGGLIKELEFNAVVSNSESAGQPLGTLAGRGVLGDKNKGGYVTIEIDEPSYVFGIVSITPRIDYSQGNKWDVNLKTIDDLHKPQLDGIGFQDLITEQMLWSETRWDAVNEEVTFRSAGKQPAWMNYMTDYNRCYGNFADENKEMFMTYNRRYEKTEPPYSGNPVGVIKDLTQYIDPSKFNNIFADTNLDAQNYWVQIGVRNNVSRKMSGKIMPNL